MFRKHMRPRTAIAAAVAALAIAWASGVSPMSAQSRDRWQPLQVIPAGTRVRVRTITRIDERTINGRVFSGVVDQDVRDDRGRLAIPSGATVELLVRGRPGGELYLDLDSIAIHGQSYGIDATRRAIGGGTQVDSNVGPNQETAERVGGGALIGSIVGAIVGGGKGAAVGAAAGAGAGASTELQVHGQYVRVPAESLVTFRLETPLTLGWKDHGYDRDGAHYHGDDGR